MKILRTRVAPVVEDAQKEHWEPLNSNPNCPGGAAICINVLNPYGFTISDSTTKSST